MSVLANLTIQMTGIRDFPIVVKFQVVDNGEVYILELHKRLPDGELALLPYADFDETQRDAIRERCKVMAFTQLKYMGNDYQ